MGRHAGGYREPYAGHRGMHAPSGYRGRGRQPPGRGPYTRGPAAAAPPPAAAAAHAEDRYNPAEDDRYQPPDAGDEPSELGEIGDSPPRGTSRSPSVEQQQQQQQQPLPGISYSDADSEGGAAAAPSRSAFVGRRLTEHQEHVVDPERKTAASAENDDQQHSPPTALQPESDSPAMVQAPAAAPDKQHAPDSPAAAGSFHSPAQEPGRADAAEAISQSPSASSEQAAASPQQPAQLEQSKWASPEPSEPPPDAQAEPSGNGQPPGDQVVSRRHDEQAHAGDRPQAHARDQHARR